MVEQGTVKTNITDGIGEITFHHPRSNSLPGTLLRSIANSITTMGSDPQIHVIVLKSEGDKVFCGGASFDELLAVKSHAEGHVFFTGFAQIILAIRSCPKLVLGRVQGKVVGGGVGVVAACDYALASTSASLRLSEYALGFGPFVISAAVQRKIGLPAFTALTVDTEWRDAAWGKQVGLYANVFPDIPALDQAMHGLAHRLAQSNPEATAKLKTLFWEGTEEWPSLLTKRASISAELILTDTVQSAVHAVQDKTR